MAAPEVIIKTTSGATSDDKVDIMTTLATHWNSTLTHHCQGHDDNNFVRGETHVISPNNLMFVSNDKTF